MAEVEPLFEIVTGTLRLVAVVPSGVKLSAGGVPPARTENKGERNTGVFALEQEIWSLNERGWAFQIKERVMGIEFTAGRLKL